MIGCLSSCRCVHKAVMCAAVNLSVAGVRARIKQRMCWLCQQVQYNKIRVTGTDIYRLVHTAFWIAGLR